MIRVAAFIDGFNLYHSLLAHDESKSLKWLNYWDLANAFVKQSSEQLVKVYYFSAIAPWDQAKADRHRIFIRALEYYNVDVVLGRFKQVTRKCRMCNNKYSTHEEKETDVNIAVTMLNEASKETFDKALLFSGDSDMIAGVKALKSMAPHKNIQVVIPYKRTSFDLEKVYHSSARIKLKHLQNNQLPNRILLTADGANFLEKPQEWYQTTSTK